MARKKFPIGVQSFDVLRSEDYVYVDKTALVYDIIKDGRIYFLSRPRRFGKSLLLSTFEAYFKGKKELFSGLAIGEKETEWLEYPVLRLDLNPQRYETVEDLEDILNSHLLEWEKIYGREEDTTLSRRFYNVIKHACEQTGRQVVVLVDEYDKPLQLTLHDPELLNSYRRIFKGFYGVFMSAGEYLKFVFLTGVSKFGKVSVFSDLNNLKDISMDDRYISVCGITETEMRRYFDDDLHQMAEKLEMTFDGLCQRLKEKYDGYQFNKRKIEGLYNPFSLLSAIDSMELNDFWFNTGTPTFLVEMLKRDNYNMIDVEKTEMTLSELSNISVDSNDPIQILYQTGYLTIKGYDSETGIYTLGFPNEEVKNGFYKNLAPIYIQKSDRTYQETSISIKKTLVRNDIDGFMTTLVDFLPEISYIFHDNQRYPERHFQEIIYILIVAAGFTARVEEMSPKGRSDIVVETRTSVFVIELKMNRPPEKALRQIDEKLYMERYRRTGKSLYSVGVEVDMEKRNIGSWEVIKG